VTHQIKRETPPGKIVGDTLHHQWTTMAFALCFDLRWRQPQRTDNAIIELALRIKCTEIAAIGEAQIGDIASRTPPLVDADQLAWRKLPGGFLQRFARAGGQQRFALVKMASRLVIASLDATTTVVNLFFDKQKFSVALDDGSDSDIGFPDCVHAAILACGRLGQRDIIDTMLVWQSGQERRAVKMDDPKRNPMQEKRFLDDINRWLPAGIDWKQGAIDYLRQLIAEQGDDAERYHLCKPFIGGPDFSPFFLDMSLFTSLLEKANLPMQSRILDVGCGPGWTSYFLAKLGHQVVGVDVSPDLVKYARKRVASDLIPPYAGIPFQAKFLVHDIESRPLPPADRFDFAVFESTMRHFLDPLAALRHVRAALRPEGVIAIVEGVAPKSFSVEHLKNIEQMQKLHTLERPYSRTQMEQLLDLAGFTHREFLYPISGLFEQTAEIADGIRERVLHGADWNIVFAATRPEAITRIRSTQPCRDDTGKLEFLDGFYPPERNQSFEFRWSRTRSVLRLHGAHSLRARLASNFPALRHRSQSIFVFVDGLLKQTLELTPERSEVNLELPTLTEKRTVEFQSDAEFSPAWSGSTDHRQLSFTLTLDDIR